jgi:hypothetical protein
MLSVDVDSAAIAKGGANGETVSGLVRFYSSLVFSTRLQQSARMQVARSQGSRRDRAPALL